MKLPKLPELPMPKAGDPYMDIGVYSLIELRDGSYWIEHESGEGMHVRKEVMEKLISDFYREHF